MVFSRFSGAWSALGGGTKLLKLCLHYFALFEAMSFWKSLQGFGHLIFHHFSESPSTVPRTNSTQLSQPGVIFFKSAAVQDRNVSSLDQTPPPFLHAER